MSEIERYNGLTTADKSALKEAEKYGRGCIYLPRIDRLVDTHIALAQIVEMESNEVIGTDLASIQMDGMYNQLHANDDRGSLTWNERINQMTAEEKARFIYSMDEYIEDYGVCVNALVNNLNWRCMKFDFPVKTTDLCVKCFINWLNSPYTEGATK